MKAIVVLADGETWTEIKGCKIIVMTNNELEALADGEMHIHELVPLVEIELG